MPKLRREKLPRALYNHLVDRINEREIAYRQLRLFVDWVEGNPEVPHGR
jgi:hypothetical protein